MKRVLSVMFTLVVVLCFSIESASGQSDSVDELLKNAGEKFDEGEEQEAIEIYNEVLGLDSENHEALWNISLLYAREGFRQESEDDQERYFRKAIEAAEKSVELHPDKGHSYYALAVAIGRMTEVMGTRDRIRAAHDIKEYAEKAAEMIPDYAPAWHLLGVWHSDVANVSRAERTAARFVSSGLPDGSNEKAEEYLKKAMELDEESILIRLDLARHYLQVGEDEKAKPILEQILEMETKTKDDPGKVEEARELLEDL